MKRLIGLDRYEDMLFLVFRVTLPCDWTDPLETDARID
jgi:hypothetical protein